MSARLIRGLCAATMVLSCAACNPKQSWRVDSIQPHAQPEPCNSVEGFGLLEPYDDDRPYQPLGGDWFEEGPTTGNLLKDAQQLPNGAYWCLVGLVTVKRIADVDPGKVWKSGEKVNFFVTHHHASSEMTSEKSDLQPLAYSIPVIIDGQTTVVFPHVILLSASSQAEFQSAFGASLNAAETPDTAFDLDVGQWPDKVVSGLSLAQLKPRGHVKATICKVYSTQKVEC